MVKAGKYVFAIQQSKGTNVIDTETDKLVKCIENSKIQGITQGADGSVWLGSTNTLERLNPETLTIEETLQLPTAAPGEHGDLLHSVQAARKIYFIGQEAVALCMVEPDIIVTR